MPRDLCMPHLLYSTASLASTLGRIISPHVHREPKALQSGFSSMRCRDTRNAVLAQQLSQHSHLLMLLHTRCLSFPFVPISCTMHPPRLFLQMSRACLMTAIFSQKVIIPCDNPPLLRSAAMDLVKSTCPTHMKWPFRIEV